MDDPAANLSPVTMSIWTIVNNSRLIDAGPTLGLVPFPSDFGDLVADLTNRSVLVGGSPSEPTVFSYAPTVPVLLEADTLYYVAAKVTEEPGMPRGDNMWFESAFS